MVGSCIYCGKPEAPGKELTTEHIIPFALGGTETLLKASCKVCGYRTSAFEAKVLRGGFYAFRERLRLPSRSKERPSALPLFAVNGDESKKLLVPIDEYPVMLHLPTYSEAGIVGGDRFSTAPQKPWVFAESKDLSALWEVHGVNSFATMSIDSLSFGRLLAKIGHSWACKQLGGVSFVPFLPRLILEDRGHDFLNFVGISRQNQPPKESTTIRHTLRLLEQPHSLGKLIVCEVTLFSNLGAPTYHVVVGVRAESTSITKTLKFPRVKIPKSQRADQYRLLVRFDETGELSGFDRFQPNVSGVMSQV